VNVINRIANSYRHAQQSRADGDSLQPFEMNILHHEIVCTVNGGAAKQQRRYEQLFHRHRYYAFS